jgi:hypothetical protein
MTNWEFWNTIKNNNIWLTNYLFSLIELFANSLLLIFLTPKILLKNFSKCCRREEKFKSIDFGTLDNSDILQKYLYDSNYDVDDYDNLDYSPIHVQKNESNFDILDSQFKNDEDENRKLFEKNLERN